MVDADIYGYRSMQCYRYRRSVAVDAVLGLWRLTGVVETEGMKITVWVS